MARVTVTPSNQLERISLLSEKISQLRDLPYHDLSNRPDDKTWCLSEVLQHMIVAQDVYKDKIETTLAELPNSKTPIQSIRTARIPSFLIKRFPPKEGKIRFKMKTMKIFQPVLSLSELDQIRAVQIIDTMETKLEELANWVTAYPLKEVNQLRFNSAVGSWVKFNVAEACEFVICHNERHMQQIYNILKRLDD